MTQVFGDASSPRRFYRWRVNFDFRGLMFQGNGEKAVNFYARLLSSIRSGPRITRRPKTKQSACIRGAFASYFGCGTIRK